jgi:hypothetical protein
MWRAEDDALFERLRDERALELLWRAECPAAPPLHPRAAGLLAELRRLPGGADAIAALEGGNAAPLAALLRPASLRGLAPPLLHHLAVYHARAAAAASGEARERARLYELAAWIALAEEKTYLQGYGRGVLGDGDVDGAIARVTAEPLEALGAAAVAGAASLDDGARSALAALNRVGEACRLSGCAASVRRRFEQIADRHKNRAIEAALANVRSAIFDATARGQADREGPALMERVAATWRWSESDEHVELFAVDMVTPIAWHVYHQERSEAELRRLIRPLEPLVESLAARIRGDATRIAYAAPCAQMYVFRSEMASNKDDQRRLAEKSLELCPSHRNGRLVLASLLVQRVRDRLDRNAVFLAGSDLRELELEVARAEELYPRTRGLDDVKQAIASARQRSSWWGGA